MTILEIIENEIKSFLVENDYRGEHSAPKFGNDTPMHDLTDVYGDDIYSSDAARLYKHYGDNRDYQPIYVIQSARNKPNKPIKIFRAVPNINYANNMKLKPLLDIVNYYGKWNFFPGKNQIVGELQDKYDINKYSYDEQQQLILSDINKQIEELKSQEQKQIGINNGDWVTISRDYAKEHGKSNLNNQYKIVSKTVPARQLFTDGNDIFEWGYSIN